MTECHFPKRGDLISTTHADGYFLVLRVEDVRAIGGPAKMYRLIAVHDNHKRNILVLNSDIHNRVKIWSESD